jgi:mRNA-degrading endonuclease RelE of RelBE toxin-antitoxin system
VVKPEFAPYTLIISHFAIQNLADMPELEAARVVELLERVAQTGVGSIEWLEGYRLCRLKIPPFRAIFAVEKREINVLLIESRDQVYSKKTMKRLKPYRRKN